MQPSAENSVEYCSNPSYVIQYPVVNSYEGGVFFPAPDAFFQYMVAMHGRVASLESENAALQESLEHEREWNEKHKPSILAKEVRDIKASHDGVVVTLRAKIEELELEVVKTLEDPRLKELDRKLTRLGRELKRTEGACRVILELETENEFLHNEIDGMNALVKSFKSSEADFKKMRTKVVDAQRQLETESNRFESVISILQEENQKLSTLLFVKSAEGAFLKKCQPN